MGLPSLRRSPSPPSSSPRSPRPILPRLRPPSSALPLATASPSPTFVTPPSPSPQPSATLSTSRKATTSSFPRTPYSTLRSSSASSPLVSPPSSPPTRCRAIESCVDGPLSAEDLMEDHDPEAAPSMVGVVPSDMVAVLYSSETTRANKEVVLTHANLIAIAV